MFLVLQQGDQSALATWYDRYSRLVHAIAYEGWRVVLNGLLQREVIASTSGLGSGTWALVVVLGLFLPWGLLLGYVLTTWLPRARLQRLPFPFRKRLIWILLIELLWTLAVVWHFSESVHEMT